MDRTERFYKIDRLLRQNRVVSLETFLDELSVSRATFKRDLEYLRDRLNAPIKYDRDLGGYTLTTSSQTIPYELPGIWFNQSEILALLSMESLLAQMQPGLLGSRLQPLKEKLETLIELGDYSAQSIRERIRILNMGSRSHRIHCFESVALAVMSRSRLDISYFVRSRNEETQREISPQRLVYYRDNWYVDAWCHMVEGVRSFALDAVRKVTLLEKIAVDRTKDELDEVLGAGYGIFSGNDLKWATLKFNQKRAMWVSQEQWHPNQESYYDDDGNFVLKVPYTKEPELLMDILKYGADVEVLSPPELRARVSSELSKNMNIYTK